MATKKSKKPKKQAPQKMDPVVHFEFPADDRKRMAKFYAKAFGWKTQMLGKKHGNYSITTTTETEKNGWPKKPGRINGGFYERNDKPDQYPSVVIAVQDIKKSMKKIEKAGGKILGEPMEIPDYGLYVSFHDSEGNRVSIMEPFM
jgi:uncharacterized protein